MNRTFNIHIKNKKLKNYFIDYIFKYKHFENLYKIFVEESDNEDLNLILKREVMRAVLRNTKGGKVSEHVKYIKNKYKNNDKLIELIRLSNDLKIHNISSLINDLKSKYKTFFTNIKKGIKASKPRTKKLKKVTHYSIMMDQISFSLKNKNKIGINLNDKMIYIDYNHSILNKITENIKNIKNAAIKYSNGDIYLSIIYIKPKKEFNFKNNKMSAIDIGIENIISLFIDDKNNNSLIFDGQMFKKYNSNFNRFIGKLNNSIEKEAIEWKTSKTNTKYSVDWTDKGLYLKRYKKYLYEKRNRFFYNEFHKLSKRITEYLLLNNVDLLILSKSLGELKNKKGKKTNKTTNQKFIQIPIIKLLDYIEMKCNENGIKVEYINEAYTSKCSCISDDVNKPKDKGLNGIRSCRGLFKDKLLNKIWNADLNGAVNHIKKYDQNKKFDWLKKHMYKICNPIKLKCDYDFIKFMNNKLDKENNYLIFNVVN